MSLEITKKLSLQQENNSFVPSENNFFHSRLVVEKDKGMAIDSFLYLSIQWAYVRFSSFNDDPTADDVSDDVIPGSPESKRERAKCHTQADSVGRE